MIDFHQTRHHQAVEVRAEAAEVCGEFQRQHRYRAVGKVDAGAAEAGLLVERAAGRDVLPDVGDVHLQLEIVGGQHSDEDGSVEVAGCFSVDGDDGQRAEVAAPLEFVSGDGGGNLLCFFQSGRGEVVGEMELADGDFDVDAEVVFAAEDLDYFSSRALCSARPVSDFDVDGYAFEVGPVRVTRGLFA